MELSIYFENLQQRINADTENRIAKEWLSFADCQLKEGYFLPTRPKSEPSIVWPNVNINDCIDNLDMMIYQQLKGISDVLKNGKGDILAVRPNYGTGIIASMYGSEIFIMPYKTNTLPCTKKLPNTKAAIKHIIDEGCMDFSKAFAGRTFNFAERWLELSQPYESLKNHIYLYAPDLQGPFPIAEMLWGADIYKDIIDEPKTVHEAVAFFADVILAFLKKYRTLYPPFDEFHSVDLGMLFRGGIIIRNDALMNISGDMYRELIQSEDQRILDAFGGGFHFCGKGDHYIKHLTQLKGISLVDMTQPEYNDMEYIYQNTIDKGIVLTSITEAEAKRAIASGRNLRGRVYCRIW